MKCPKCNEAMPDNNRYCLQCGAELVPPTSILEPFESFPGQEAAAVKGPQRPPMVLVIGLGVVVVALVVGIYVYTQSAREVATDGDRTLASASPTAASPTPNPSQPSLAPRGKIIPSPSTPTADAADAATTATRRITPELPPREVPGDGVTVINRRIHISPRSYFAQDFKVVKQARLRGTFDASSPVEVALLNHQNIEYYHSARINDGSLDVTLQPGDYYLLFENRFSLITSKDVRAVMFLQY